MVGENKTSLERNGGTMAMFLSSTFVPVFNSNSMNKTSKKWIRLIGIVGCTMWMASCKTSSGCTDEIFLFNYESGSGG